MRSFENFSGHFAVEYRIAKSLTDSHPVSDPAAIVTSRATFSRPLGTTLV